jgi:phosphatidylserine/phosphatidylglycerophosphate/cardiolipin synthase-like enzyme
MLKQEKLILFGLEYFQQVIDDINRAQSYVLLEIHYIDLNKIGETFLSLVTKRLREEISFFIIIDGLGYSRKKHS